MKPTRLRFAAAAAAIAAVALVSIGSAPGRAVSGVEVGSWWQGGGKGAAPPQVIDGGPWVSGSPAGANAISAIRFHLADDQARPFVTLKVHQSSPPKTGGVKACPTTGSWTAGTAQGWVERPAYDCAAGTVLGQWSNEGDTIQLDLSSSAATDFDLAIIPDAGTGQGPTPPIGLPVIPNAPTPPDPAFDIAFAPVGASDITFYSVPAGETTDPIADSPGDVYAPFFPPSLTGVAEATLQPTSTTTPPAPPLIAANPGLVPVSLRETGRPARVMAAVVFALLALWWWRLSYSAPVLSARRLTLYDDPTAAGEDLEVPVAREGRVPALR